MSHRHAQRRRARTSSPGRGGRGRTIAAAALSTLLTGAFVVAGGGAARAALPFEVPSLDGSRNNVANPDWGRAGQQYSRVGTAHYADGRSAPLTGPNARYISNRIFNDNSTNLFSEHRASGWGWTWGQFLDHTIGLKQGSNEAANIPFDARDPMESYRNDFGVIQMTRAAAAPGTGVDNARQQVNLESSYIDAEAVYGASPQRLEWLRDGSLNNNPADNAATLMLPGGYLPTAEARGNAATAPGMDVDGPLRGNPAKRFIAGDVRANENLNLTSTQTLFAREHNRIVAGLPNTLTAEEKFQVARRVVIAEQQYITYNEFLPSMSVKLPAYTGYKPSVNASISNEFAAVGYRMHSMIHSETEIETQASRYTEAQLAEFEYMGIEVERLGDEVAVVLPLGQSFFNPTLLPKLQLGAMLQAIGNESQYRNDEQMANALRSVLFQVPVAGNPSCIPDVPEQPQCFRGVSDLAAIDIQRPYDHGLGTYNDLRRAYGLPAVTSFTQLTGESTDQFPRHASLTRGREIDDPNSLDFVAMADIDGNAIDLADEAAVEGTATSAVRRTTLAARLKAIYGSVDKLDPFTGILAEPHLLGSEMGQLQTNIWKKQFLALRDGDRFFYGNQTDALNAIKQQFGVDYRKSLKDIIVANSDADPAEMADNVFLTPDAAFPAATCDIRVSKPSQWPGGFQTTFDIRNTGTQPINGWTLFFQFGNGQAVQSTWQGRTRQTGPDVRIANESYNAVIPPGGTVTGVGFLASWDNATNAPPINLSVNNRRCTSNI
jgi:hypothetical protein